MKILKKSKQLRNLFLCLRCSTNMYITDLQMIHTTIKYIYTIREEKPIVCGVLQFFDFDS